MGYCPFSSPARTLALVSQQAGRRCAPGSTQLGATWLGLRAGASNSSRDSATRAHDLIFLVLGLDINLRS